MASKSLLTREEIKSMYADGVSSAVIAEKANLSVRGVRYILNQLGVKMRKVGQPRQHKVNEKFFDSWSKEMAWVLGFIVTDGCISNNSVNVIQKDTKILRVIADKMDADFVLTTPTKTKRTPALLINSKHMKDRLFELGVTENKSLSVDFPNVPNEFRADFIRGVVDGDGSVLDGYRINITTGSAYFADGLYKQFIDWGLKTDISDHFTKTGYVYRVWVRGKESTLKLAEMLYRDCDDMFVHKKRFNMESKNEENDYAWATNDEIKTFTEEKNSSREKYKNRMYSDILNELRLKAKENHTNLSYLLESGFERILSAGHNISKPLKRNAEKAEFLGTCDRDLLASFKDFAKENKLTLSQAIELSVKYIDANSCKKNADRYKEK